VVDYKFLVADENYEEETQFSFFNSDQFVKGRSNSINYFRFYLLKSGMPTAKFVIYLDDKTAFSPWKAPYGSFELASEMSEDVISYFLEEITNWCVRKKINSLKVIAPPEFYQNQPSNIFIKNGYRIIYTDLHQYFRVAQKFSHNFAYSEKKRLNKCQNNGFTSSIVGKNLLPKAHELLTNSRKRKGYPVTMTFESLVEMFQKYPENYLLFAVFDKNIMISMAVSIRVNKDILYNFYHADHDDYATFSPTVMVVNEVNKYALKNGFQYIDLGISSNKGILNKGLYTFKKNLGSKECSRHTYLLEL